MQRLEGRNVCFTTVPEAQRHTFCRRLAALGLRLATAESRHETAPRPLPGDFLAAMAIALAARPHAPTSSRSALLLSLARPQITFTGLPMAPEVNGSWSAVFSLPTASGRVR